MTDTGQALYAAICADPWDDTLRLAYADFLEGQDVRRVLCLHCKGTGWLDHDIRPKSGPSGGADKFKKYVIEPPTHLRGGCHYCGGTLTEKGTGTVLDTEDADRAELTRIQLRLEHREEWKEGDSPDEQREQLLKDAHPEWSRLPCPACGGDGREHLGPFVVTQRTCETCGGAGDLLKWVRGTGPNNYPRETGTRHLGWRAGDIDSVTCTLAELGSEQEEQCQNCNGEGRDEVWEDRCGRCDGRGTISRFIPSQWAVAVVRARPVTRFVPTDKKPVHSDSGWWWASPRSVGTQPTSVVTESLFRLLVNGPHFALTQSYRTDRNALDALALACGRVVREYVYGKVRT